MQQRTRGITLCKHQSNTVGLPGSPPARSNVLIGRRIARSASDVCTSRYAVWEGSGILYEKLSRKPNRMARSHD